MITSIQDIIAYNSKLSSLPDSLYQLNALVHKDSVTISEISEIVSGDPVLAARILRVVNSPFYGFPSKIETIPYAISILGMESIRYIALTSTVVDNFSTHTNSVMRMDKFWRHSFSVAILTQKLAKLRAISQHERLFATGLFHELGRLLLTTSLPDEYKKMIEWANSERLTLHAVEKDTLGFDHLDVTASLLQQWNLPPSIAETIRNVYATKPDNNYSTESALLFIADEIAANLCPSIALKSRELSIPPRVWKNSGIHPDNLNTLIDEMDSLVGNAMSGIMLGHAA